MCYLKQLSLFKEDLPFVNHAVSRTSIIVTIPHLSPNHGKSCGTMGLLGYLKKSCVQSETDHVPLYTTHMHVN